MAVRALRGSESVGLLTISAAFRALELRCHSIDNPLRDLKEYRLPIYMLIVGAPAGTLAVGFRPVDERLQQRGERRKLAHMNLREGADPRFSVIGEPEPHDATVVFVCVPRQESEGLDARRQFDHAVVAHEQVFGCVTDRRPAGVGVAFDCEQKLVLDVGEPDDGSLLFTPPVESAQRRSEPQQSRVVEVSLRHR